MIRTGLVLLFASVAAVAQDDFAAAVRRGNDLMRAGKYAEAAAVYETQTKTRASDPGLRANLGMAYFMAGRPGNAVNHLEAAAKLQPGNMPVLLVLGQAYLGTGDSVKAVATLSKAAAAAPDLTEVHQLLGQALLGAGQPTRAVPEFERWTSSEPGNPAAWYGLARSCQSAAADETDTLIRADPESAEALALLASKPHKSGNLALALHLYRQALQRDGRLRGVHAAIADIYTATGHPDWAAQERAKEPAGPANSEGRYGRIRAMAVCAEQAHRRLEQLGDSVELHAIRALIARDANRHREAVREWRLALNGSPGNVQLEKELAVTLRLSEDYAGARTIAEKLVKSQPESAEINYLMGQILVSQQEADAAVPYLVKATRLNPAFLPARGSLGLALLQLGRDSEAVPHLEAALPLDSDGSYHFRLSRAYEKTGNRLASARALAAYRDLHARSEAQRNAAPKDLVISPPEHDGR